MKPLHREGAETDRKKADRSLTASRRNTPRAWPAPAQADIKECPSLNSRISDSAGLVISLKRVALHRESHDTDRPTETIAPERHGERYLRTAPLLFLDCGGPRRALQCENHGA